MTETAPGLYGDTLVPCPRPDCGWQYAALCLGEPGGGIFAAEVAAELQRAARHAITAHLAYVHGERLTP